MRATTSFIPSIYENKSYLSTENKQKEKETDEFATECVSVSEGEERKDGITEVVVATWNPKHKRKKY
jgi:hypothetical protein